MTRALPEGWAETSLGEVCTFLNGRAYKQEELLSAGKYPVLRVGNFFTNKSWYYSGMELPADKYCDRGDLLYAWSASFGPRIWEGNKSIYHYHIWKVVISECILKEYAFHFLNWDKEKIRGEQGVGSTMVHVTKQSMEERSALLPPLAEQRRIVEKIEALTARSGRAREALAALPALLKRYRAAVLAAAFRGDLTAEWREEHKPTPMLESLKGIPVPQQPRGGREATETVIPGLGGMSVNDPETPLPPGWAWVPLLRIARQETGHTPSRGESSYWGGDIPWIGIKDAGAHHGGVIDDTFQHVTQDGLDNSSARQLPMGTVCLSRTASVGYVVMMGRDMATSQDFATWTCGPALDPAYLMYALLSEGEEIRRFGKGSTHTTIYFPEIRAFHIALAPIEEQREIVRRIRQAMAAIPNLDRTVETLTTRLSTLDSAILAKAFRGELVPQDPTDEPASVLLERIRAERAVAEKPRRGRRTKEGRVSD